MTSGIPASSIPISKLRVPELDELVTRGWVAVDFGEKDAKNAPVNVLHAFSELRGRRFRTRYGEPNPLQYARDFVSRCGHQWRAHLDRPWVWYPPTPAAAPLALCVFILLVSSVICGMSPFHLHPSSCLMAIDSPLYFASVTCSEIMRVSESLATKLVEKELAASVELQTLMASGHSIDLWLHDRAVCAVRSCKHPRSWVPIVFSY